MTNALTFKQKFQVKGISWAKKRYEEVRFSLSVQTNPPIAIHFSKKGNPITEALPYDDFEGEATCSIAVSSQQFKFVDELLNGKYSPYWTPFETPIVRDGNEIVGSDGLLFENALPIASMLSPDLLSIIHQSEEKLRGTIIDVVKAFRWRYSADSPPEPVSFWGLYWHASGEVTRHVPLRQVQIKFGGIRHINITEERAAEIGRIVGIMGVKEPLGHSLLYQARYNQKEGHFESAVVLAFLSLEAGLKKFLGSKSGEVSWLLENQPSPNVHKMLHDLVPLASGIDLKKWETFSPIFSKVKQLMECRNKIMHTGVVNERFPAPDRFIRCVEQVLYLLDALSGLTWAYGKFSKPTREIMGWTFTESDDADENRETIITITNWQ
jgi:hypothetical protein